MDEFIQRLRDWLERARDALSDRTASLRASDDTSTEREVDDESTIVVAGRDDDVASIVGRIDTADTMEVILVVRGESRALRRPTAWPHISAHARRRGIVLAVVSARRDVRTFARQNGLRAANSINSLRPAPYMVRVGDRDVVVPPVPWSKVIRGGMILAMFAIAFIIGCVQLPTAQVTIVPRAEAFEVTGRARPNAIVDESDPTTGTLLATTIRRQIHTAVTTSTTGEVEVGDARAALELRFVNDGTSVVQVPVNTRVQDEDGVGFLTTASIDVPAAGEAIIAANAEFPGVAGNVAVGTVTEAEGLPPTITVSNTIAGTGGTNKLTAAVSQEDVDRVHAIANDILIRVALSTLKGELEGATLIDSSISVAIFSEQPAQLLGEPSDIFIVDYVITASALIVTQEDADEYGTELIRSQLPAGMALIPRGVVTEITIPEERGELLTISATGQIAELQEIEAVAQEITGKSISSARSHLSERLSLLQPPEIEVRPDFIPWLWLPRRADHIEVVIAGLSEDEEAEATTTPTDTDDGDDPDTTEAADAEATETAAP